MNYKKDFLIAAHKHSSWHKQELLESNLCGCFYCLEVFSASEIFEWIDEQNPLGASAFCPKCGIDSVIGSKSDLPVSDKEFLRQMQEVWFS